MKEKKTRQKSRIMELLDLREMIKPEEYDFSSLKVSVIFFALLASIMGIIVIGSAEKSVQGAQIAGLIAGLLFMAFFMLVDYKWLVKFYWILYVLSIVLLMAVVLFGDSAGGAERWLILGPIRFQPSEIVKIFLIIFFSVYFKEHKYHLKKIRDIIKPVILIGFPLALILMQPDLSTTIVTGLVFCSMIFVAGLDGKFIGRLLIIVIPILLIAFIYVIQPGQKFLKDYQQKRILAWMDPEKYADSDAMQQQNSIMAIGSGQLTGKGINNNKVASMKNGNFVPEPQTDFIFAVVGEELGFVGTGACILLLMLIVLSVLSIGKKCADPSGRLLCIGMGSLIGFQSMVNISVATGLIPNTGVTLPFYSYGVTSLMSFYIGLGIVLNVSMQSNRYQLY